MNKRKFETAFIASLIIAIICLSGAVAYLFELQKQAHWRVNLAYGLVLYTNLGVPVASLDFTVDQYGSQTQSFKLVNTSNKDVNVTETMPSNTTFYGFATTFGNETILKGNFKLFTVTLVDFGMTTGTDYSGTFNWDIVADFPKDNEQPVEQKVWFESSEIVYGDDTSPYLEFVSESFDKTEYNLSETVQYSFTTKAINPNYTIDGFSYKIWLFKSGVFQTEIFSGYYDVIPDLQIDMTNTTRHTFNAPSENGTYRLQLTYNGHNADPILPLYQTYTVISSTVDSDIYVEVWDAKVTGFSVANEWSTLWFAIYNAKQSSRVITINVTILEDNNRVVFSTVYEIAHYSHNDWTIGFYSPTTKGHFTILIAITQSRTA